MVAKMGKLAAFLSLLLFHALLLWSLPVLASAAGGGSATAIEESLEPLEPLEPPALPELSEELLYEGDYTYRLTADGDACIVGYSGSEKDITTPLTLGGHAVTEIYGEPFNAVQGIRSVTVSEGVTTLRGFAFYMFSRQAEDGVGRINIPSTLLHVGYEAFAGCAFTEFVLPDGVLSIGNGAFRFCDGLERVYVPASVAYINMRAFWQCPALTIYGDEGTEAQSYAEQEEIPFAVGRFAIEPQAQSLDQPPDQPSSLLSSLPFFLPPSLRALPAPALAGLVALACAAALGLAAFTLRLMLKRPKRGIRVRAAPRRLGYKMRALLSLKARAARAALVFAALAALLTALLSVFLVYRSSSEHARSMRSYVAGAVTLRGPSAKTIFGGQGSTISFNVPEDVALAFVDSGYVQSYNLMPPFKEMLLTDCSRYQHPKMVAHRNIIPYDPETRDFIDNVQPKLVICQPAASTRTHAFFTSKGFELASGQHLEPGDFHEAYALVSDLFARSNGLGVGDSFDVKGFDGVITLTSGYIEGYSPISLTIKGTYAFSPSTDDHSIAAYSWDEYTIDEERASIIFATLGPIEEYFESYYESIQNFYNEVNVFLRDPGDIEAFIDEAKAKIKIGAVTESFHRDDDGNIDAYTIGDWLEIPAEDVVSHDWSYHVLLDRGWYEMVAKPMEKASGLTGIMVVAMAAGSAVVLALIVALMFKGRRFEFGVLLAMGETRGRVFKQMLAEALLPALLAAAVALAASGPLAGAASAAMLRGDLERAGDVVQLADNAMAEAYPFRSGYEETYGHTSTGIVPRGEVDTALEPEVAMAFVCWVAALAAWMSFAQMAAAFRQAPARLVMQKGQ